MSVDEWIVKAIQAMYDGAYYSSQTGREGESARVRSKGSLSPSGLPLPVHSYLPLSWEHYLESSGAVVVGATLCR